MTKHITVSKYLDVKNRCKTFLEFDGRCAELLVRLREEYGKNADDGNSEGVRRALIEVARNDMLAWRAIGHLIDEINRHGITAADCYAMADQEDRTISALRV